MSDKLSRAASEIWRLAIRSAEGEAYDAAFDGGEWSAKANHKAQARGQYEIARRFGYDHAEQLWGDLEERTSSRWMHECFPPLLADDEYEYDSIHGRSRNR